MSVDPTRNKVFLPHMENAYPLPRQRSDASAPPRKPERTWGPTVDALIQAAAGTLAVTVLNSWGGPDGMIGGVVQALPSTALAFGGPLALGVLASQAIDAKSDALMHAGMASGLAVAGMMATNMIPRIVDMATVNTVLAAAAGVYAATVLL